MTILTLDHFMTSTEISPNESVNVELKIKELDNSLFGEKILIIPPYIFEYRSYCKSRWENKSLRDLFSNEFKSRPISQYQKLVDEKRLLVNHSPVDSLEYIIRNGDYIIHRSVFIELPISSGKVVILYDTPSFLVVYKPYGIPCHPQGRFKKLSLTEIIKSKYLCRPESSRAEVYIHPINRLDRCTSGLVLLSKNPDSTRELSSQIKCAQKFYLAKIKGSIRSFISTIRQKKLFGVTVHKLNSEESYGIATHVIKCEVGLNLLKDREGDSLKTCIDTSDNGKYSLTYFFALVSTNNSQTLGEQRCLGNSEEYSIILCKPITGRTHQIRAHLQYIGFPIFQDLIYENISNSNFISKYSKMSFKYTFPLSVLKINEILRSGAKEKHFGGGGVMNVDPEKELVHVEYFIEPPIGICLHSLLYILKSSPSEKSILLKCPILPKWLFENTNIDIKNILDSWPIWNNKDSGGLLLKSQKLF